MLDLISRLDGVRENGEDQGLAFCPAHEDRKSRSLSWKNDGEKWLLNCFAGCTALEVCHALGIEFGELFHDRRIRKHDGKPRVNPRDVLTTLEHEAVVVLLIAEELEQGRLSKTSQDRITRAVGKIGKALEAIRAS